MLEEEKFVVNLKIDGISDKVMEIINERVNQELFSIWDIISLCESPVEQLFCLKFDDMYNYNFLTKIRKFGYDVDDFSVQYKIGKYRADFALILKNKESFKKFIIEIDGHDFHEKTKEQAKKDKEKDRFLISEGYIVVRFTGSEIYNDCSNKVSEFINLVEKECGR